MCPGCRAQGIYMLPLPYPKRGSLPQTLPRDPQGQRAWSRGGSPGAGRVAENSPGRPCRERGAGRRRRLGPRDSGPPPCPRLGGAGPRPPSSAAGRSPPGRSPRVARASAPRSPPPPGRLSPGSGRSRRPRPPGQAPPRRPGNDFALPGQWGDVRFQPCGASGVRRKSCGCAEEEYRGPVGLGGGKLGRGVLGARETLAPRGRDGERGA